MRDPTRRSVLLAAFGGGLASTAGCVDDAPDGDVLVTDDLTYEPAELTIEVGDTVTWVNVGRNRHTVTAYEADVPAEATYFASGGFADEDEARAAYPDGALGNRDAFEHTFSVPGDYRYFCIPHESAQQGRIAVSRP